MPVSSAITGTCISSLSLSDTDERGRSGCDCAGDAVGSGNVVGAWAWLGLGHMIEFNYFKTSNVPLGATVQEEKVRTCSQSMEVHVSIFLAFPDGPTLRRGRHEELLNSPHVSPMTKSENSQSSEDYDMYFCFEHLQMYCINISRAQVHNLLLSVRVFSKSFDMPLCM